MGPARVLWRAERGTFAQVTRWSRWRAGGSITAMTRLVQVALRATDLDRAAAFYSDLLGTRPSGRFDPPGLLFFDLDGTRLLLEGNAPASMLYLEVSDVHRTIEALRGRTEVVSRASPDLHPRGRLPRPSGTTEWQAFVTDSEGNSVGLVSFESTA